MCSKIACDQHTQEQKKVIEDFDKLIGSKLKDAKKPYSFIAQFSREQLISIAKDFEGFEVGGIDRSGRIKK